MGPGSIGTTGELDELATIARGGDRAARDLLFVRLAPRVLAFARAQLPNTSLWEDATQEALARIFGALGRFEDGNFLAWALTITRNSCIDVVRSEQRHARRVGPEPAPIDAIAISELRTTIEAAVRALPQHLRDTLLLRAQGFRYADIAALLQIPVGTVRSRLHDARATLREQLLPLLEEESDDEAV